jgi:cell division transport system permease protein
MNRWWAEQRHALRSVMASLKREPWAWLGNIAVVATAIVLPLVLHLALRAIAPTAHALVSDPEISVYLALDAPAAAMADVGRAIEARTAARKAALPAAEFTLIAVPKAQALARFSAQARSTGQGGMSDLKFNPLPDGFILRARHVPAQALQALAEDLRKIDGVEHVQVDAEWAGALADALRWLAIGQWILMTVFGAVVVAVTFGAARAQVLADREEIAIARLIGATDAFVRRPFVMRGALLGMLGGALALAVCATAGWLLGASLRDVHLLLPAADAAAASLVLPAVLGGLGGWWCAQSATHA